MEGRQSHWDKKIGCEGGAGQGRTTADVQAGDDDGLAQEWRELDGFRRQ